MELFRVSYIYASPSPAGPFRGRTVLNYKPAKGDIIPAMFGRAVVNAVSRARTTIPA